MFFWPEPRARSFTCPSCLACGLSQVYRTSIRVADQPKDGCEAMKYKCKWHLPQAPPRVSFGSLASGFLFPIEDPDCHVFSSLPVATLLFGAGSLSQFHCLWPLWPPLLAGWCRGPGPDIPLPGVCYSPTCGCSLVHSSPLLQWRHIDTPLLSQVTLALYP